MPDAVSLIPLEGAMTSTQGEEAATSKTRQLSARVLADMDAVEIKVTIRLQAVRELRPGWCADGDLCDSDDRNRARYPSRA